MEKSQWRGNVVNLTQRMFYIFLVELLNMQKKKHQQIDPTNKYRDKAYFSVPYSFIVVLIIV